MITDPETLVERAEKKAWGQFSEALTANDKEALSRVVNAIYTASHWRALRGGVDAPPDEEVLANMRKWGFVDEGL